jgi:hypothetical protein
VDVIFNIYRIPNVLTVSNKVKYASTFGRAIAEAVNRWLPTAGGPGSRPGVASGICGGQSGVEAGFLRVLPFPLSNRFIPSTSPS